MIARQANSQNTSDDKETVEMDAFLKILVLCGELELAFLLRSMDGNNACAVLQAEYIEDCTEK